MIVTTASHVLLFIPLHGGVSVGVPETWRFQISAGGIHDDILSLLVPSFHGIDRVVVF